MKSKTNWLIALWMVLIIITVSLVTGCAGTQKPDTGQTQNIQWKDATCETATAAYAAAEAILNGPVTPSVDAQSYWNSYKAGALLFLKAYCGK